jgi:N-methylhydantoinase A
MAEVDQALQALAQEGIEALAICFLYAYLRPEHERQVLERARQLLPGVFTSASSQILPEFREYERLSTTVTNAFLGPTMARYIEAFRHRMQTLGVPVVPYINQSNGGTISIDEALRAPVKTLLSGPSAGVVGAAWLAQQAGVSSLVTFDMGGTSTDVAVVRAGQPALAFERDLAGVPLRIPALDIHTIGAGGGSIAWRDSGGALMVGPQSAGADPGPACYGRGGEAPTVTDANLLLGRLTPQGLLGGRLPLHVSYAQQAIATLGASLGLAPQDTARGILQVVNANMARALRLVTVQRGVDPMHLALLPFGGAGPLHAGAVARELNIPQILVPPRPGILCALGLLVEELRVDAVRTWVGRLTVEALAPLAQVFRDLEAEAQAWLERERVPPARRHVTRYLDLRYAGQNYELLVPVPEAVWQERAVTPLCRRFCEIHEETYGFATADEPIQVVNVRLVARGLPEPLALPRQNSGQPDPDGALLGSRVVDFADQGGRCSCRVYDRERLSAGSRLVGPAVLEQFDSTILLHPGQEAVLDEWGCVRIWEA